MASETPSGPRPAPSGDRPRYGGARPGGSGGGGGRGGDRDDRGGGDRSRFGGPRRPRRKVCSFCVDKVKKIDFKDIGRIRRYVSERGKIDPRRKSGNCATHQRMLTTALKRARHMAMLPYTADHVRAQMSPQARAMAGGPPAPRPERPPYRPAGAPFPPRPPMQPGQGFAPQGAVAPASPGVVPPAPQVAAAAPPSAAPAPAPREGTGS